MKFKYRNIIAMKIILVLILSSFSSVSNIYIANNGRVNFKSEAPLELIKASSNKLTGILNTDNKDFVFQVPMRSFEGFNSPLQRTHFNENYIESHKYPDASFKGKIIEDIDFKKPGTYKVRAKGRFAVHGKENPMTIKADLTISRNEITVSSEFEVLLKDHDIQIPTIVNQKLSERINVSVRFILKPKK
jgi:polyisoprenoid-binding protein YceI